MKNGWYGSPTVSRLVFTIPYPVSIPFTIFSNNMEMIRKICKTGPENSGIFLAVFILIASYSLRPQMFVCVLLFTSTLTIYFIKKVMKIKYNMIYYIK
jgi:hypothetical protein